MTQTKTTTRRPKIDMHAWRSLEAQYNFIEKLDLTNVQIERLMDRAESSHFDNFQEIKDAAAALKRVCEIAEDTAMAGIGDDHKGFEDYSLNEYVSDVCNVIENIHGHTIDRMQVFNKVCKRYELLRYQATR